MKHILRKAVCALLAAGLMMSLSACGNGGETRAEPAKTQAAVGESLSTLFFDFTVNQAGPVDSYADYTAEDGEQLVVANVTVTNTTDAPIEMYDSDFTLAWGEAEDAFAWVFDAFADAMQPAEETLNPGEGRTYDLLYAVPAEQKNLTLCYTENYQDEKGAEVVGFTFKVIVA